eukprot:scaffold1650_cov163-Amphora_coffeaeformis.AAC.6
MKNPYRLPPLERTLPIGHEKRSDTSQIEKRRLVVGTSRAQPTIRQIFQKVCQSRVLFSEADGELAHGGRADAEEEVVFAVGVEVDR